VLRQLQLIVCQHNHDIELRKFYLSKGCEFQPTSLLRSLLLMFNSYAFHHQFGSFRAFALNYIHVCFFQEVAQRLSLKHVVFDNQRQTLELRSWRPPAKGCQFLAVVQFQWSIA
jgi:hypothetical protein